MQTIFLLKILSSGYLENEGNRFLQMLVSFLPDCTESHPRRQNATFWNVMLGSQTFTSTSEDCNVCTSLKRQEAGRKLLTDYFSNQSNFPFSPSYEDLNAT
jgi:hypothetical protein